MNLLPFFVMLVIAPPSNNCSWDLRTGDENFGGALPIAPESWVTSKDYPEGIVGRVEKGLVQVEFSISSEGRVTHCHVNKSSGFSTLDAIPCKLLSRRARFSIPKDSKGNFISTDARMTFYFSPDK